MSQKEFLLYKIDNFIDRKVLNIYILKWLNYDK